jgi:hypothetical protein
MEIYDDLTGEAEKIMKQTIKAAKTKPKSDFLGSKIDSFPQLCLRVGGLCWWAGIELQKEMKRQGRHPPTKAIQVAGVFDWESSVMGIDFWYTLDSHLRGKGAYNAK